MSLNDYFWNIFINKGTCQLEFKDAFSRTNLFSLHRKNPIRDKDLYYKRFKKQKNKKTTDLLLYYSALAIQLLFLNLISILFIFTKKYAGLSTVRKILQFGSNYS